MADSEQTNIIWCKSTKSGGSNCVEVALADKLVLVRNSRDPLSSVLAFSRQRWAAFLEDVTAEEFTPAKPPKMTSDTPTDSAH